MYLTANRPQFATSQATKLGERRFTGMVRTSSRSSPEATPPAYRVEAPRVGDAVGVALRDAFEREIGMPDDMRAMLRRLDRSSMVTTA